LYCRARCFITEQTTAVQRGNGFLRRARSHNKNVFISLEAKLRDLNTNGHHFFFSLSLLTLSKAKQYKYINNKYHKGRESYSF
jgi:hypothetical protein